VTTPSTPWPTTDQDLAGLQDRLANAALQATPFPPEPAMTIGGCFVAFARGEQGPGHPGDHAWAAAVTWRRPHADRDDGGVLDEHVVAGTVPASYTPGLLARREGPILAAAVDSLGHRPDVLLVDATGLDHPRRAGLALHLGAAVGLPSVGVTHRGLVVRGDPPAHLAVRGDAAPVLLDGAEVAAWVCTRSGARPLLVHAAWRTDVTAAVEIVLRASTERARTPVPLQEARRLARVTRHRASGQA
jgi:deoxyribonuclease V